MFLTDNFFSSEIERIIFFSEQEPDYIFWSLADYFLSDSTILLTKSIQHSSRHNTSNTKSIIYVNVILRILSLTTDMAFFHIGMCVMFVYGYNSC